MKKIGMNYNKVKYAILFVITFFFLFNFSPITSYACSCAKSYTVEEELEQSAAVFAGEVVEIVDKKKSMFNLSSTDPIAVKFEVEESWKGLNQTQVTVYTERYSASCGYEFNLNTAYLVYAHEANGAFNVNLCSRTTPLLTAEMDISELGKVEKLIEQVSTVIDDEDRIPLVESIKHNKENMILLIVGLIMEWTGENTLYIKNEDPEYPNSNRSIELEIGKEIYHDSGLACQNWLMEDEYETCYQYK
ncbi:hypothetical protein ACIQ2D_15400 [Lysinibacillus sp. NPDC097287]|uniref:hypothetical protein n=1 Tax=Lysinibacillus sp. NPDC097287 TaxID=3364144 RepID=UPI0038229BD1